MTVEGLEALGADSERYELLEGVPHEVMLTNLDHGEVIDKLYAMLTHHVRQHRLGKSISE